MQLGNVQLGTSPLAGAASVEPFVRAVTTLTTIQPIRSIGTAEPERTLAIATA